MERSEEINEEIKDKFSSIKNFYDKQYKKLLIIPFALLFIAIVLIAFKVATTGDFINRDVSLKGGITVTIPITNNVNIINLENKLKNDFPRNDVRVRSLSKLGNQIGMIVEADLEQDKAQLLLEKIQQEANLRLEEKGYSIEIIGSSFGASFFREIVIALLIAFLFMGVVVFLYFRT